MSPVFDLEAQQFSLDSKIAAALERLGQAFRVLLWQTAKRHNLSPIQVQFLVYLLHHSTSLCRVSQIAREFGLTQATVSDAVDTLEVKGLVYRDIWPLDARVSVLRLTTEGEALANELSAWADTVSEQVSRLPVAEKEAALSFLMQLIESLQRAGVITIARMCVTCRFFGRDAHPADAAPHHCYLLDKPLAVSDLRVDCPEHEAVVSQA